MTSMTTPTALKQAVFVGIDTHKATHHGAVVDADGRVVADRQFATTGAGCEALEVWLDQWQVLKIGIEQTGTYGAALTRQLDRAGHLIIEVNTTDIATRARIGKSDPIDAVMAAQTVRATSASVVAKDRGGVIESIRALTMARNSAVKSRSQALTQLQGLAITTDPVLRDRLGSTGRQIVAASLRLRPDPARLHEPIQAAKVALRSIASRVRDLDEEIKSLDTALTSLLTQVAPRLLARPQVGIHTAAQLLITAGQNPDRIATDAAFARLTGVAPIPASSGQTHRMRLHRGGDRQANRTIHMIAVGRLKSHQPAIDYLQRRTREGHSKKDAIRAMKRLIARELHGALKADLKALDGL